MNETVKIHGDDWKLSDIQDEIDWCKKQSWVQKKWKATQALIHKNGGRASQYLGQKFDPEKIDLVEDGWDHDHCLICWHTLFDSEEKEDNSGRTDGNGNWVCLECYDQFLKHEK